jgi:SAM-dependent methyltransferase
MTNALERGADVYYHGTYWNDYDQVRQMFCRRISSSPRHWWDHLLDTLGRPSKRALILNCGNGWIERELLDRGVILSGVGVDYATDLLEQARTATEAGHLPLAYHQVDTNAAEFPEGPYDLVVNHAAGHHVTYVDRVFRSICRLLPSDGTLVNFDYVGPHRNQYPWRMWEAAHSVNKLLPVAVQQPMAYPHEPTMLSTDPTEAVHPELLRATIDRYFISTERVALGGAIAYLLITHNEGLARTDDATRDDVVRFILEKDDEYLRAYPDDTLFLWSVARPNKAALVDQECLDLWSQEEDAREAAAREHNGRYYPMTLLQEIQAELADLRLAKDHLTADLHMRMAEQARDQAGHARLVEQIETLLDEARKLSDV